MRRRQHDARRRLRPTCKVETCGNGLVDPGEVCDDGNTAPATAAPRLHVARDLRQRHRRRRRRRGCDDTSTAGGDGCSPLCEIERCGNGVLDVGEACDDGNAVNGDGCRTNCTPSRCAATASRSTAARAAMTGATPTRRRRLSHELQGRELR